MREVIGLAVAIGAVGGLFGMAGYLLAVWQQLRGEP